MIRISKFHLDYQAIQTTAFKLELYRLF